MNQTLAQFLKYELFCEYVCQDQQKDILIVVKDGLDFVKPCIESVFASTKNFVLHLWDNGSDTPTKKYLAEVAESNKNVRHYRVEENLGFIKPANRMAEQAQSPYLILLNSDTLVRPGWDRAMLGYLQEHASFAQVGYEGGLLQNDGWGLNTAYGEKIDYVMGWCVCMSREMYEKYGLFDEVNYTFAYFEDSDLSLRLQEAGYQIYALHLDYVQHLKNGTVKQLLGETHVQKSLLQNWRYFKRHWRDYLTQFRISCNSDLHQSENLCYTRSSEMSIL